MGGTKSPNLMAVTKDLWAYCISKMIKITLEHVPANLNQIADHQSRHYRDSSNWKLQTQIFNQIENCLGPVEIDLFADRINTQKTKFMETRPRNSRRRCILCQVDEHEGICIPTILPDRKSFSEDQTRQGNNDHSDANMADITLVPGTVSTEPHKTIAFTPNAEFVNVPNRRPSSAAGRQQTNPGSMENFGQNNPSGGMSEATKRLPDQTRRTGSKRTYATPWEKWISWAEGKQVDPLQATVEDIANFLSSTFESPVEYFKAKLL